MKVIRVWKEKINKNLFYFQRIKFEDGTTETKFNISPIMIGIVIIILVVIVALLKGE